MEGAVMHPAPDGERFRMVKWTKVAAAVLAAVAVILLAYAILMDEPSEEDPTPGMGDRRVYSSTSLALIVLSSFLIAVAVMFILLREEYEPLPPSMKGYSPPPPPDEEAKGADEGDVEPEKDEGVAPPKPVEAPIPVDLRRGGSNLAFGCLTAVGGRWSGP